MNCPTTLVVTDIQILCRHLMVLCDTEKELREQLHEKKESLKKVRPPTAKMTKDKHQIKLLENRCEQALTKFNELRS